MIRDITIGRYYPADSPVHSLDPRVKLAGTLVFMVSVFFIKGLPSFIFATAVLIAAILVSKIPFGLFIRGIRAIRFILVITFIVTLFSTAGRTLFQIGPLTATFEGLSRGAYLIMRLSYLVLGASILTLTTTPTTMTDGLESALGFLNRFKVPVHETAMIMTIALRFIPILTDEMTRIMKAQGARGADFESRNLISRAKGLVPLAVPLFISAVRRADELACAMDARCYHGSEGRTRMYPLSFGGGDFIGFGVIALYIVVFVFLRKL
ncbi:MAG: energy-coupling factor transporter transmembrane protein EcfT [Lachnospiraceae bacterium]|nr:energy-coupling factor transporter transmembrane protein EcfT [Lachnospiraceae bacterium]